MQAWIRPYVTTGVALVGASVIAVTPIQAAPADTPVATPAVQLAAVPSPFELYPRVIQTALANTAALAEEYSVDPFSIISATLDNQAAGLSAAVAALANGDSRTFFAMTGTVIIQPVLALGLTSAYLASLIPRGAGPEVLRAVLGPMLNGVAATGAALRDVVEALATFDLLALANAVVNIPARIVDGVLNGGYFDGTSGPIGGLLTPLSDDNQRSPGPIAFWTVVSQEIGYAIRTYSPADTSIAVEEPSNTESATSTPDSSGPPPVAQEAPEAVAEILSEAPHQIDTEVAETIDEGLNDEEELVEDRTEEVESPAGQGGAGEDDEQRPAEKEDVSSPVG